jgi:hypothetical protein
MIAKLLWRARNNQSKKDSQIIPLQLETWLYLEPGLIGSRDVRDSKRQKYLKSSDLSVFHHQATKYPKKGQGRHVAKESDDVNVIIPPFMMEADNAGSHFLTYLKDNGIDLSYVMNDHQLSI